MSNIILNILGIAILGNMIAWSFTPIQPAKRKLISFLPRNLSSYVDELFSCSQCVSFWLYLIVFQDIIVAAIAGFIGLVVNLLYDLIKSWYE